MTGQITRKIKEIINPDKEPITKDMAKSIQTVGKVMTPEERLNLFYTDIDDQISKTASVQHEDLLVVSLDSDLISKRDEIIDNYKSRNFTVYELTPVNNKLFILSWE